MLTLAIPPNVLTSKSGRSAKVSDDPVQAVGPKSATSASATTDVRDPLRWVIHADMKFRALTDTNNLPRLNITLAHHACLIREPVIAEIRAMCSLLAGSVDLIGFIWSQYGRTADGPVAIEAILSKSRQKPSA